MKIKIINIAILLVNFFGTLVGLSFMPDTVPVHFNGAGVADRWGSKYELMIMSVIMLVMLGVWFVADASYRRRIKESADEKAVAEAKANVKVLGFTFTAISLLFTVLNAATIYMSYSQLDSTPAAEVDIFRIMTVAMGIAFVVLGNIMPKAKKNSLVGLRLPWTRYNDVTWQKSNRFAGYTSVIAGIIIAVCALIFSGVICMIVMMIVLSIAIIAMSIYAYLIYMDEKKQMEK